MKVRSTQTSVQPEVSLPGLANVLQVSEALKKLYKNRISRLPFKDSTNQLLIVCSRRETFLSVLGSCRPCVVDAWFSNQEQKGIVRLFGTPTPYGSTY